MKLSALTPKNFISSLKLLAVAPFALMRRNKHSDVWLVAERQDQARDNGYCFFKFLREQHPEIEVYYVIAKEAEDRKKIEPYGNIIDYDSWKHYLYFCLSKIHISAHDDMCAPSNAPAVRYLRNRLNYKNIFLPHGVSYGISEFCLAKYHKFDLFICSGRPEYENVLANYGYAKEQLAYTGFPRLDYWHDIKVNEKQIVLMPTWRLYLAQSQDTEFEETTYFKTYQSLINNSGLCDYLETNGLKLIFYLHHGMRKYVDYFSTDCRNIEIVSQDEQYDIQELLKSSALLITDYSSVHFDFAYMNKSVLYYQFDQEEFFTRQYQHAAFDAETDGFGPVAHCENELLHHLREAGENSFKMQKIYYERMRNFYQLYDNHNCERVYGAIMERMQKMVT